MPASYVTYQAVGDSYLFPIPFPYLNPAYIKVSTPSGVKQADLDYIVEGVNVRFLKYKPVGTVTIRRETPITGPIVPFADGSLLNARVLSSASSQALQGLEETRDYIDAVKADLIANLTPADSPVIASQLTGMQASLDNVSASISNEQAVRASSDDAMAYVINQITAATGGAQALSQTGGSYSATWTAAQANYWNNLRAEVFTSGGTTIRAALAAEATTRASADSAMATNITSLTSRIGAAESAITTEQTTRATADSTMASEISSLKTRMGSAEAAITTEQTTRASGDSANASSITSLTTRMNNAEAAITTEQTTRANQYGQLSAQYTVKVDVNGNVAGFDVASTGTVAGGTASKFRVLADRFEIAIPGSGNYVPFAVGGGGLSFSGETFWNKVTGTGRPADNATVGADATNLNIGLGTNLLANTEFVGKSLGPATLNYTPLGFANGWWGLESVRDPNGAAFRPAGGDAICILQASGPLSGDPNATYAEVCLNGIRANPATGLPVVSGRRYEFSCKAAAYNCKVTLFLDFFDQNGAWLLRAPYTQQFVGTGGKNLENWSSVVVFGTAPANSAFASVLLVKCDTWAGASDSYAWFAQPVFAQALASQTVASPYSPGYARGAISSIDKLTATNIATYMEQAIIGSAFIGDAQVGTLKIAGEAVVVPRSAFTAVGGWVGTSWTTIQSVYIDAGGANVSITASADGARVGTPGTMYLRIVAPSGTELTARSATPYAAEDLSISLFATSTEVGTYTLQARTSTNGRNMSQIFLQCIGAKR